jgi:predicted dehydrogenase
MNRRHFIATAASSIALASHAAETTRKWRVVVLGNKGSYGHSLDTMWLKVPGTEIVAAADPDATKLEATLKELNITQGFADYHEIAKAQPDLVAIGPAMGLHRDMVLVAAASGARGIYLEKPFCRTLALAHRNRWHPTLPVVKRLVQEGVIGRLLELRGRGKEDRRGGMEDLWVLGSHVLNLGVFLAGKPIACSAEVLQDGKPMAPADVISTKTDFGPIAGNEVHARFDMDSGVPFYFDSIKEAGDAKVGFGLQLIGTKGIIDIRVDQTPLAHLCEGSPFQPLKEARTWVPISAAGVGEPEPVADIGRQVMSHATGALDLIACIEDKSRQPLCSGTDGRLTVEMITAVLASHIRNGERIRFPLSITENPLSTWK